MNKRSLTMHQRLLFFTLSISLPTLFGGLLLAFFDPVFGQGEVVIPIEPAPDWSSDGFINLEAVAWGDIDGDGDLDLAAGGENVLDIFDSSSVVSETVRIYSYEENGLSTAPTWESAERMYAYAITFGDLEGDGDLDMAVGHREEIAIFENVDGTFGTMPKERLFDPGWVYGLEWGDVDNDGDLDLVAGSIILSVHYNDGGTFENDIIWYANDIFLIDDLALGDANNDGLLDVAVAPYSSTLKVYTNDLGVLEGSASWEVGGAEFSSGVAWGDVDRDGDLDLAFSRFEFVENGGISASAIFSGSTDIVFYNDKGLIETEPSWESFEKYYSGGLSWADVTGDGYLDLVSSGNLHSNDGENIIGENSIYINEQGILQTVSAWNPIKNFESDGASNEHALGDFDGDGDLDWASGLYFDPIEVHTGYAIPFDQSNPIEFSQLNMVRDHYWGDIDGDGDPDLAVAQSGRDAVYLNLNGRLSDTPYWESNIAEQSYDILLADVDNDYDIDLVVSTASTNKLYLNTNGSLSSTPDWESAETRDSVAITLGDVDGDLDLDLLIADLGLVTLDGEIRLYRFDSEAGRFETEADWQVETDNQVPFSVDLGDVDLDGDLDLAIGTSERNQVYFNGNGTFSATADWETVQADATSEVRWGDIDGDGYPDLVAGNEGISKIYKNDQGSLIPQADWTSNVGGSTFAILLEDVDQDGDLDFIETNRSSAGVSNHNLFINEGGELDPSPVSFGQNFTPGIGIESVDIDGDGDVDISLSARDTLFTVILNTLTDKALLPNSPPSIHINDIRLEAAQMADETILEIPYSISDPDGDPIGSIQGFFSVDGGRNWRPAVPSVETATSALVPNQVSEKGMVQRWTFDEGQGEQLINELDANDKVPLFGPQFTTDTPLTRSYSNYALSFDGVDDRLDIPLDGSVVSDQMTLSFWYKSESAPTVDQPLVIYKGEGDADGRFGLYHQAGSNQIILRYTASDCTSTTTYTSTQTVPLGTWTNVSLLFTDTLAGIYINGNGEPVNLPDAGCQQNGELRFGEENGQFYAMTIDDLLVYDRLVNLGESLSVVNQQREYIFGWDTTASGFFGRSEAVLFRLEAYSTADPSDAPTPGRYLYYGSTGYETTPYPVVSDTSEPFRLQGLQVRVTDQNGTPVEGALVYQIKPNETIGSLFANPSTADAYRTDSNGFLTGRGEIFSGSGLVALAPISATHKYTVYHTSALPTQTGLDTDTVTNGRIQTLSVSPDHPLLVYNPIVSLEWDARNDSTFLGQLEEGIVRASQVLYDATNGQAAIGQVGVYHDKGLWEAADIVIRASNQSRPSAILGGSVLTRTVELIEPSDTLAQQLGLTEGTVESVYLPGQISMPTRWGQFGSGMGELGEDWARTLAHEFGHYLFFLPDNYLGLDDDLNLTLVECPGSIMDNPYLDQNSEFADPETFSAGCDETLAAYFFDQSDWEIIQTHYPYFNAPTNQASGNSGPSVLPLAITQLTFFSPPEPATTLDNRFFPVVDGNQDPLFLPIGKAEGFLLKNTDNDDPADDFLVELGSVTPNGSFLEAWGVEPGDQICLFDYSQPTLRQGCVETVGNSPTPITLLDTPGWSPELTIRSISTDTLQIDIADGLEDMEVQLLTPVGRSSNWIQVSPATPESALQSATVTAPDGAFYGYIRVRSPGTPSRELIIPFTNLEGWDGKAFSWGGESYAWDGKAFSWGGKAFSWGGKAFSWGGKAFSWGGKAFSWGGKAFSWGGKAFSWGAPTASPDGQMSVFPIRGVFDDSQAFTVSRLNSPPNLPAYLTTVGQAYRLIESAELSNEASILFSYLSRDVLGGGNNEQFIRIYHLPAGEGGEWAALETKLDPDRNIAVTKAQGDGIYVLAMALDIGPLNGGVWNQFAYPNQRSDEIEVALSALEGKYSAIYQPPTISNGSWPVYAPSVDSDLSGFVNDLSELSFGFYWIYMTESVNPTLLPVDYPDSRGVSQIEQPPMTLYGSVVPVETLQVGSTIEAVIGNTVCGQAQVVTHDGQPVYKLQVTAASLSSNTGCGQAGALVTLRSGNAQLSEPFLWNSSQVTRFDINPAAPLQGIGRIYLPLIGR